MVKDAQEKTNKLIPLPFDTRSLLHIAQQVFTFILFATQDGRHGNYMLVT